MRTQTYDVSKNKLQLMLAHQAEEKLTDISVAQAIRMGLTEAKCHVKLGVPPMGALEKEAIKLQSMLKA